MPNIDDLYDAYCDSLTDEQWTARKVEIQAAIHSLDSTIEVTANGRHLGTATLRTVDRKLVTRARNRTAERFANVAESVTATPIRGIVR